MSEMGIVRETFTGQEIERRGETAASALVAREQAEVQARFVMAMRNPRDTDQVRAKLIRECQRTTFAESSFYAIPRKGNPPPVGKLTGREGFVEGLTVRFAEAAIRLSTNIKQVSRTTYDDATQRNVYVAVIDLETNTSYEKDITIPKTVERSYVKEWQVVISKRTNSANKEVFLIEATEEEIAMREASAISKAFRTLGLRLVPADTIEDCQREIVTTITAADKKDPDAARKKLVDAFLRLNVTPADLATYLGHEIGKCSPAELTTLRGVFAALRDGETTWSEVIGENEKGGPEDAPAEPRKSKAEKLAEKVAAKAAPPPPAEPPQRTIELSPDGERVPDHVGREPGDEG